MKRAIAIVMVIIGITGVFSTSKAMSFPNSEPNITLNGKLNCPYISANGGTAYLQIALTTSAKEDRERKRRPMNIAVVLDRSGSMADERKIEFAKSALNKLIDQLHSDDLFSLVVYDDVIDVLQSAQRVGNSQRDIKRLVSEIYPRNSTNLGGGMMEGLRQVERNLGKEYVNRVILLSDGLANQGVTDQRELSNIARNHRNRSISLTTMGVGLDYNENLMVSLSESGGGNYYFIESPSQLASIMSREFQSASSVVAQNAFIELKLGRGVKVVDVIGCESSFDDNTYKIPVGDLYSNDSREFTVELSIPEALPAGRQGSGSQVVVTGALRCDCSMFAARPSFTAKVNYTREVATIEKNRDMEVQAKADIALSTRKVDNAMKALDEGRGDEAKAELTSARQVLMSSPAATVNGASGAAVQEQAARLDSFDKALKDDDSRRAKKKIQYENYRVQKKK
jgi:Ca-activated chloride channel homolog